MTWPDACLWMTAIAFGTLAALVLAMIVMAVAAVWWTKDK